MPTRFFLALLLALSIAQNKSIPTENGVYILNEGNFAEALTDNEFLLVLFYARKIKRKIIGSLSKKKCID